MLVFFCLLRDRKGSGVVKCFRKSKQKREIVKLEKVTFEHIGFEMMRLLLKCDV